MHTNPPHLFVAGDFIAGAAVAGWWIEAYEAHIGVIVTTMAGIYYIIKFVDWLKNRHKT